MSELTQPYYYNPNLKKLLGDTMSTNQVFFYRDPSDGQLYHDDCLTSDEKKDCEPFTGPFDEEYKDELCAFCEEILVDESDDNEFSK